MASIQGDSRILRQIAQSSSGASDGRSRLDIPRALPNLTVRSGRSKRGDPHSLGREPINPEWLADFRFDTHSGLKSDTA